MMQDIMDENQNFFKEGVLMAAVLFLMAFLYSILFCLSEENIYGSIF